nr:MAG TPA: hypothetical protein [Caudoviricetes sp.]
MFYFLITKVRTFCKNTKFFTKNLCKNTKI